MKINELMKVLKRHPKNYSINIEFISENADDLITMVDDDCEVVTLKEF